MTVLQIDDDGFELLNTPRKGDGIFETREEQEHDAMTLMDLDVKRDVLPYLSTKVMGYVVQVRN
jgi:hypothetical protein